MVAVQLVETRSVISYHDQTVCRATINNTHIRLLTASVPGPPSGSHIAPVLLIHSQHWHCTALDCFLNVSLLINEDKKSPFKLKYGRKEEKAKTV